MKTTNKNTSSHCNIKIYFKEESEVEENEAVLAFVHETRNPLEIDSFFLSAKEKLVFDSYSYPRRQKGYLLGRFAGKIAIDEYVGKKDCYKDFTILNGDLNYPYILNHPISITLSHTEDMGVAIAHAPNLVLGVDLEEIERLDQAEIDDVFSDVALVTDCKNDVFDKRLAWVAMEALSKALRLGLTIDLKLLKPSTIEGSGFFFKCNYSCFPVFSAVLILSSKYVLGICYCNKMQMRFDADSLQKKLDSLPFIVRGHPA